MRIEKSLWSKLKTFTHEKPTITLSIALGVLGILIVIQGLFCYGEFIL
jgi:hypothetical protein